MKGVGKKLCRMKQLKNRAKSTAGLAPLYMHTSIEMPSGPGDLALFCLLKAMHTSSILIHKYNEKCNSVNIVFKKINDAFI